MHLELDPDAEGLEHVRGHAGIGADIEAEAENLQFGPAMQPEFPMELHRLERDDRVALDPGLQPRPHRPELPRAVVADEGAHGELVGVEHQIGVRLEQAEHLGPDAPLARVAHAEVEVPAHRVVEIEQRLGAAADLDHLAGERVFVEDVEADQERPLAPVDHRERPEQRILREARALLEDVALALDEEDRAGKDNGEQEAPGEGEAVVGHRADGDAAAEGDAALLVAPLDQVGDADLRPLVPPFARADAVPGLVGLLVGLHVADKEPGEAVEPEAGGPERDPGRQLGPEIDRHEGVAGGRAEDELAVDLEPQGRQLELDRAVEAPDPARQLAVADRALEAQDGRDLELDPDAVQRHRRRATVVVPDDAQALDAGAGRHALHQLQPAREAQPLAAVLGAAEAHLGDLELEAAEIEPVALAQVQPAAFQLDVAVGVDRELAHLEARPVEAADQRPQRAAEPGDRPPCLDGEAEALQRQLQHAGLGDRDEAVAAARQGHVERAVEADPDRDPDRRIEEGQLHRAGDLARRQGVLPQGDAGMLQRHVHAEQRAGERRGPVERDLAREAAIADEGVVHRQRAHGLREPGRQVDGGMGDVHPAPAGGLARRRPGRVEEDADLARLHHHAAVADHRRRQVQPGADIDGDVAVEIHGDRGGGDLQVDELAGGIDLPCLDPLRVGGGLAHRPQQVAAEAQRERHVDQRDGRHRRRGEAQHEAGGRAGGRDHQPDGIEAGDAELEAGLEQQRGGHGDVGLGLDHQRLDPDVVEECEVGQLEQRRGPERRDIGADGDIGGIAHGQNSIRESASKRS